MVYSNAVSTKMQLWTARGLQNLQELLAKMGCPLEECRQPFPFMKPALRRTLREKFLQHGEVTKCIYQFVNVLLWYSYLSHHPHCTFRNMAWRISNLRALSE